MACKYECVKNVLVSTSVSIAYHWITLIQTSVPKKYKRRISAYILEVLRSSWILFYNWLTNLHQNLPTSISNNVSILSCYIFTAHPAMACKQPLIKSSFFLLIHNIVRVRFAIGSHYLVRRPQLGSIISSVTLKEAIIRDVLLVIILEWDRVSFSC